MLLFSGCIFRENERALSLYSRFKFVKIDQCEFTGNEAIHSGEIFASALKRHRSIHIYREMTETENFMNFDINLNETRNND